MLERGPPLWSAVYPPAGSSLQHAHQLQLLSHQQLLRQQELYMIQHQTAQVIELQRNAQLVVRVSRLCQCNQSCGGAPVFHIRKSLRSRDASAFCMKHVQQDLTLHIESAVLFVLPPNLLRCL